ncbi:MAG: hypothetical protein GAK29_03079 [Acinetobacter bereziniae]|uniref:Uncharacterized protein n=1 Tax=Acinetobacter bereziniae TaxID=106648 RepID=A0A833PDX1_ACIBZ|nr:MAG: hypothetical protein GAK29_03079 [Acinetobacter bereziniae]
MKKNVLLILSFLLSSHSMAMEALSDADLQNVEGQAGADLSLKLILNQVNANDSYYISNNAHQFDSAGVCKNVEFCRLAVSVNNRYVDANGAANSVSGNKLWVVFKGIQGTINIQKLGLDGTDLIYMDKAVNAERIKPAIQLSYDATNPIQIRNFGFNALSIEQDNFISRTNPDGTVEEISPGSTATNYGYLKKTIYDTQPTGPTSAVNSLYDQGNETGFMGLRMNGNLALQGKIMMFSCSSNTNARC